MLGFKTTTKKFSILINLFILFFLCHLILSGQAGRGKGRLNGLVVDEEGKPVAGAKVVIQFTREKGIQFESITNKKGEWAFLGLGSGLWIVTATAEGFMSSFKEVNVSQIEANPKLVITLKKIQPVQAGVEDKASLELLDRFAALFQERKYDEAIEIIEEFRQRNPEFYPALINLAECYREKGDYQQAIKNYELALELSKKGDVWSREVTAKSLAGIGECYLRQGNLDQAQDFFKRAVDFSPDNEMVAYNVGEIYFSSQKMEEAIYYFNLAIKIKPKWSLPYYKLGLVYLNKADYELARGNFEKFLELEPDSDLAPTVKNILEYLQKIKK